MGAVSMEAAISGAVFLVKPHRGLRRTYLGRVLLPELRRTGPGAVLVMDPRKSLRDFADLPAHKAPQVRALPDASGFACRYLPPCSPDLNPIAPAWPKVKAALRRVGARMAGALHEAFGPALACITPQDTAGYFRHLTARHGRPGERVQP